MPASSPLISPLGCLVWKNRNDETFNGIVQSPSSVFQRAYSWACCFESRSEKVHGVSSASSHSNGTWIKPPKGWVCLNCDGSVQPWTGLGSAGGVLRDSNGLRLAWNHGVANLEVQSDNSQAVKLINSSDAAVGSLSLIRAIASLRNRQWETRVRWIPRSKNCVADSLSKMAPFGLSDATYFETPTSGVAHLVEREAH
ncbi:hypothetical protein F3Y22_tig00110299pilonHSYRG00183 [Hibiscus syriacus]|uniref:RNase H type-1 domain-containing protein n=1 Tax=Hibiscus syriacus TaxID=106335 RepID=A0A6A3B6F1_HIBSY|nr:hypothetical protein F3Y22_tig00110299pilonHSYRG00183 [Hibiscus syriacus]